MKEDWIFAILTKDLNYIKTGVSNYLGKKEYYSTGSIKIDGHTSEGMYSFINRPSRANRCGQLGDVLQARMKDTDKAILIDEKLDQQLFSTGFIQIRPNPETLLSKYIYHYFKSMLFLNAKDENCSGSTQSALNDENAQNLLIPIAPLPIQRAIVSKIEALFSDLDNGIVNFKKAQEQLKIYRQAVLKKAFEGELTKEWREKLTNLPTAEELLKQIKEERQNHYNQQIEDWKKAVKEWEKNGSVGKKPKRPSALTIPDKPNAEHISRKWDIPDNWAWTQVGEVCFVTKLAGFEYTDYVKYDPDGDLAVIKAENAGLNGFKKTNYSKIKSESVKMLNRSMIYGGELLVVFVGAGTGNVATVPQNKKFFLGPNIGMARPYFEVNTRYIELFLQSPKGKHMLMATAKAVAQPSLSMGTIRQTPFVYCSLQEQTQIVQEIESRLSVCDKMEQSITESIEKAEALRQSILKKAFEGKLLSEAEIEQCKQAADYEPASELLKKIQAEKLAKELEKKKKPTVKKKSKK